MGYSGIKDRIYFRTDKEHSIVYLILSCSVSTRRTISILILDVFLFDFVYRLSVSIFDFYSYTHTHIYLSIYISIGSSLEFPIEKSLANVLFSPGTKKAGIHSVCVCY